MNAKQRVILGKFLQSLTRKSALSQKASLGQGEDSAAAGGSVVAQPVPEGVSVIKPNFAVGSIWERCTAFPVDDRANGGKIPYASEDVFGISGMYGGVEAYTVGESGSITPSAAAFNGITKQLGKTVVAIPVTREILQDVNYLGEYSSFCMSSALKLALDYQVLYATNSSAQGGLSGIIAASGGYTAATTKPGTSVSRADLEAMVAAYYGGDEGVWMFSKSAWNNILTNVDQYISIIDFKSRTLFGMPYRINPAFQAAKCVLGDFSQYGVIHKPVAESMDAGLYFLSDQMVFKAEFRVAGQAMWKGPVTLDDGTAVYPFVATT